MKNTIAFQSNLVILPYSGVDNRNMAMNVQAELMKFGYMLSPDALTQVGHSDAADILDFFTEIIDYLKKMTGGQRNYTPIYSGFPQEVMNMTEYELWENQLLGYWWGGSFKPSLWTETRKTAFEHVSYKMLEPGTENDFGNIFTSLAQSGTSLTPTDSKKLTWFIHNYEFLVFPEKIPFKENLCLIFAELSKRSTNPSQIKFPKLTTTDVLRIAVHMSGGDISLPAVPKKLHRTRNSYSRRIVETENPERVYFEFKKFTRKERKFILNLLEHSNLDVRDMKLKDQRWVRLGEILHPGEYQGIFPKTYNAFQRIRNEKVVSWYGEVQKAFNISFDTGLAKLSERPAEFLRKLDWLVRKNGSLKLQSILDTLARVGYGSSNKVLFEVYTHFEERLKPVTGRKIFIKGARQHTKLPDLPALSESIVEAIQSTIFTIIKDKFKDLSELGDCWIDEDLKKIPLPTNMRSMSDTLVPVIRGQRIPMGETKKVIRPYIHWFDPNGNLDIDLHGYLFSDKVSPLSFGYNGRYSNDIGCYSGDVRHRRGACAEYVDIIVDKAVSKGFDYFLLVAHNYGSDSFAPIKECVAGVMERDEPTANMTWLPSTIANSMRINTETRTALVGAYDLKTREYIHLDLDFGTFGTYIHSGQSSALFDAIKPFIEPPKLSVYDLMKWHVEARGRIVSKETATTHFLYEDFSSSYTKTIEYMGV